MIWKYWTLRFMLQKIQCVFDSNFLTTYFIILFGLLKYVLSGSQKHVYMARQGMYKLFTRKQLHLSTDNETSKISTNLNTVSMILLHSAIIIWYILQQVLQLIVTFIITIINKKMLHVPQPFISNLFRNVNLSGVEINLYCQLKLIANANRALGSGERL